MSKKFAVIGFAVLAFGFASAPRLSAGTEVIEPHYAPTPSYNYAPPPPPPPPVVYYAPPPVRLVVYPGIGFYARPVCAYGYQRFHAQRAYCPPRRHW